MSDPPVPEGPASRRWPLEPEPAELRRWFDFALERALAHVASLAEQPAVGPTATAAELAALVEPLPAHGVDPRPLIERLIGEWVPRSFTTAGPGYLAFVPGGGLTTGALADLISGLTNRFVGVFAAAPLLTRLKMTTLR